MFACPLGVPGLGELPLKLGVLDNLLSRVWGDFLAVLDELLLVVLDFPELFPFLLVLFDLAVVGC